MNAQLVSKIDSKIIFNSNLPNKYLLKKSEVKKYKNFYVHQPSLWSSVNEFKYHGLCTTQNSRGLALYFG